MPTALDFLGTGVINGKIYAVGGVSISYSDAVEAYDPGTDTWTTEASMPTARELLTASVINGTLYAVGGYNGNALSTVEAFSP
jgi:N-acetylneuraminic acid mutarotase